MGMTELKLTLVLLCGLYLTGMATVALAEAIKVDGLRQAVCLLSFAILAALSVGILRAWWSVAP
jgi:hypothetical protein